MTTAHLVAGHGIRVVNLSRPGDSIQSAEKQRVEGGIHFTQGSELGTAIWIALGANDFVWGFSSLEEYRSRYLTVLNRIEPVPGQKIFCVTPLISRFDYSHQRDPEGATLEDYRQIVRSIAGEGYCILVETSEWFDAAEIYDECHMPGSLHLGEDGHIRYTIYLREAIRDVYTKF